MSRPRRLVRWIIWLAFACACPAEAARYGDLVINASSTRTEIWSHGYNEHLFLVGNQSDRTTHRLTIELPSSTYGNYGLRWLRRTVDVPPGATVQLALPQPPVPIQGPNSAAIRIDGVLQDETLQVPSLGTSCNRHYSEPSVLVSRGVAYGDLQTSVEALQPTNTAAHYHGSRSPRELKFTRAEAELAQWNGSWLDYTRFDGVMLGCAEWNAAPAPVRDSLVRYVAAGGTVALVGAETVEDPLPTFFGVDKGAELRRGLGRIMRFADAKPSGWGQADLRRFVESAYTSSDQWRGLRDGRRAQFRIVEQLRIPVRGIYFLLVLFAILIGPVMLRILARRDRRIWLFWIAPAVSLVTCAFIFLHALLSEGTRPTIRTEAITLLDQESRLAVSLATTGFYCPLTPSGGLSFGLETEVTPLLDDYERGRRTIDCSTRQHFENGWVLSRVPAAFLTRSVAPRHERLDCTRTPDGGLQVVNGLGAPIRHLRIADAEGRVYHGEGIAAGGSLVLSVEPNPSPSRGNATFGGLAGEVFFDASKTSDFTKAVAAPNLPQPQPGHYVAVLDGAPFADDALPGPGLRTETTLLLGRFAPAAR